jgi:hypothetical protein
VQFVVGGWVGVGVAQERAEGRQLADLAQNRVPGPGLDVVAVGGRPSSACKTASRYRWSQIAPSAWVPRAQAMSGLTAAAMSFVPVPDATYRAPGFDPANEPPTDDQKARPPCPAIIRRSGP